MLTRLAKLNFSVPQVREGGGYPIALERGCRSERAMNLGFAEMYVQGISTRKMIMVLQKWGGPEIAISSTHVSRCNAPLNVGLAAWRNRPFGVTPLRRSWPACSPILKAACVWFRPCSASRMRTGNRQNLSVYERCNWTTREPLNQTFTERIFCTI